jgi:Zn-dependent peptidase ImmA (M78 family)
MTLLGQANAIANNVIESREVLKSNFGSIKTTSIKEHHAYENIQFFGKERYSLAADEADIANNNYWVLMKPLAKSYRDIYQHYLSSLNDYLKGSEINAS